jgi:hypothetical protein
MFLVQHKQLSVRLKDKPFFITTNRNAVRESTVRHMVRTGKKCNYNRKVLRAFLFLFFLIAYTQHVQSSYIMFTLLREVFFLLYCCTVNCYVYTRNYRNSPSSVHTLVKDSSIETVNQKYRPKYNQVFLRSTRIIFSPFMMTILNLLLSV